MPYEPAAIPDPVTPTPLWLKPTGRDLPIFGANLFRTVPSTFAYRITSAGRTKWSYVQSRRLRGAVVWSGRTTARKALPAGRYARLAMCAPTARNTAS